MSQKHHRLRHQSNPERTLVRIVCLELPFAMFLALGTAGAIWVSDDFDTERLILMASLGFPGTIFYYGARCLYPNWTRRWPLAHGYAVSSLALIYLSGVIPLVNAATAQDQVIKRTIEQGHQVAIKNMRRGGLGMLFRSRW